MINRLEKDKKHSGLIKIKIRSVSVLPADIDVAVLSEQDVGDLSAAEQQIVLDVSGLCCWGRFLLILPIFSGETHFQVIQGATGHKVLQFLSGTTSNPHSN